jgi:hypothetical protein
MTSEVSKFSNQIKCVPLLWICNDKNCILFISQRLPPPHHPPVGTAPLTVIYGPSCSATASTISSHEFNSCFPQTYVFLVYFLFFSPFFSLHVSLKKCLLQFLVKQIKRSSSSSTNGTSTVVRQISDRPPMAGVHVALFVRRTVWQRVT